MTSSVTSADGALRQLYVWIFLPGALQPVVAGALTSTGRQLHGQDVLAFTYAGTYRTRPTAVSLFTPELPLTPGTFDPTEPVTAGGPRPTAHLHSCIRDAAPDAWGRRVINLRLAGDSDIDLSELTYLAESTSDRIGALDFQASSTEYTPRGEAAALDQLLHAAELIEAGQALPPDLEVAADHGTSIGGARPKALLKDGDRPLIAKFSSSTDTRPVVKAEAAAMLLAARVGIDVAPVEVREVAGKDVLLVERFDRTASGSRRQMVSTLTVLGRSENEARYATYADLADSIRIGPWTAAGATLRELFTRLVFNVCVGNTDDHLRNHAAFWDGEQLTLTPAYDVAPQPRSTSVATHAIGITREGNRYSQLTSCRKAASDFTLSAADAEEIIDHVVHTVEEQWADVCDEARLTKAEAQLLWGREFLNPYVFYNQP